MKEKGFRLLIILGLIILGISEMAKSQTVSFSPTSIPLWGQAPATAKVSASYGMVEATYLHTFSDNAYDVTDKANPIKYDGGFLGLFVNPISIEAGNFEFTGGAGYFFRKYPTENGTHVNFQAKVSYSISETIGLQYTHISNGFGAFSDINPGADNLSLTVSF